MFDLLQSIGLTHGLLPYERVCCQIRTPRRCAEHSSFETLVDREAPDIEHEPVTMIQHDQQSRWKAWMRLLAVDIRPISYEHGAKGDFAFDRRHESRYPPAAIPVGARMPVAP
jgi:hypothetical protein